MQRRGTVSEVGVTSRLIVASGQVTDIINIIDIIVIEVIERAYQAWGRIWRHIKRIDKRDSIIRVLDIRLLWQSFLK